MTRKAPPRRAVSSRSIPPGQTWLAIIIVPLRHSLSRPLRVGSWIARRVADHAHFQIHQPLLLIIGTFAGHKRMPSKRKTVSWKVLRPRLRISRGPDIALGPG